MRSVNVSCKTRRDRTPASRAMAARYTTGAKAGRRRNSPNRLPEDVSKRGQTRTGLLAASVHVRRVRAVTMKFGPPSNDSLLILIFQIPKNVYIFRDTC